MNKNKHLLTALFLAGTLLTTTSCGNVLPANTLVVGLECDYAPFNWTQTSPSDYALPIQGIQGQYADGYDVQIARYIAKDLNYDIQIKKIEWDSLISSLRANQINVIIAGMSETPIRATQIDFSDPYYTSEMCGLVKIGSGLETITNIQELSGHKVISQLGTVQDQVIDQISGVNHLTGADSFDTAALMVRNGNADCLILEYPVAANYVATYNDVAIISFTNGNFTGLNENDLSVSVGVNKNNRELKNLINESLANLTAETRNTMMEAAGERIRNLHQ